MAIYQRRSTPSAWAFVAVGAFVVLLVALLIVLLGGGGAAAQRSTPQPVHDRVVQALQRNDAQALYDELSPAMQQAFPREQWVAVAQGDAAARGPITAIQALEAPTVRTGAGWNGEWADARVQVARGAIVETYVARYRLEEGQWWLSGTIRVP